MSFKSGANGIEKQGKTKGRNLGDDGPKVLPKDGGKKTSGVTGQAMRAMGRNLARAKNQG